MCNEKRKSKLCMTSDDVTHRRMLAKALNVDRSRLDQSGITFAWVPARGFDNIARKKRWLWMEWMIWFSPVNGPSKYETYAGSGREFYDLHGRFHFERGDK